MRTKLALDYFIERCNLLAHNLQTNYEYKLTKTDFDLTLRPLSILYEAGFPNVKETLLANGLEAETYGFLIGWLELSSLNCRTLAEE